ncbi:MAG TPA: flagellar export chaperone FliS [Gemmatimonadaceae bacterium]|jgi:flagellar protein FliS|nr:flagellar export chaperone FliS [Gemmatimonadaceae bacterium]
MTYGHAASSYREREILTASPAKLVVIVFDHMLANLRRARIAIDAKKIEARIEAAGKARGAVLELWSSTDVERGGQLAWNLRSLYVFMFTEIAAIVHAPDAERVDRLTAIAVTLREGFATIAANPAAQSPAA